VKIRSVIVVISLSAAVAAQDVAPPPTVLPASATAALATSLERSSKHTKHVWRDTAPFNDDGTVNAYVEIARGDRRKWELDIGANARRIDRMMPSTIGGYPINYGFVPQTISYDGDPFDALVLGPPLQGGRVVRGRIVGVMYMEDEKGLDSKVVLSRVDRGGQPLDGLTEDIERKVGDYFKRYKEHQPGAFSKVPGWGSAAEGQKHVTTTHTFFKECRLNRTAPCEVNP
jgi:inorganic pyrophosphatase